VDTVQRVPSHRRTERDDLNNAPTGQLVGSWTDARNVLDDARADLDQALSERRELPIGERVGPRDRGVSQNAAPGLVNSSRTTNSSLCMETFVHSV
jgi:hypothetical protein